MTITRAIAIILATAIGLGTAGGAIGFGLGKYAPSYYRAVFVTGRDPDFDPLAVGIGLGITQGMLGGLFVGSVVVLAVAIASARR
jgi:hypothetical protein